MNEKTAKLEPRSRAVRKVLWTLAKYGVGLALLGWLVWSNRDGLAQALRGGINILPLAAAVLICVASVLVTFLRWFLLVRAQKLPFSVGDAFRLGMVGYSFSTLLPGSIGGDVIKAAFLAREQSRRTVAVATVMFDRVIGLTGLVWLAAILGFFFWLAGNVQNSGLIVILYASWGITLGSLLFWLLLGLFSVRRADRLAERISAIPKVGGMAAELWRAAWMYRRRSWIVAQALALAMIGHSGFVLVFFFASLTLNISDTIPSLIEHFLIIPVGMVVQALPLLPGGIGVAELAFSQLHEMVGSTVRRGFLASFIQRMITWSLALLGYIGFLWMRPSLTTAAAKSPARPAQPEQCVATEL